MFHKRRHINKKKENKEKVLKWNDNDIRKRRKYKSMKELQPDSIKMLYFTFICLEMVERN